MQIYTKESVKMKVTLLKKKPDVYSCNVYLVRGEWNAIEDVNTLIDVGTDGYILNELPEMSTGVGKRRVEQIILTHEHFDHSGGLMKVKAEYNPKVIAYSQINGVDVKARDGMKIKIGEREAVILHTPGHSNDSICIYCPDEKILFSGDTPLNIKTPGGSYSTSFVDVLKRLIALEITTIYSGHDDPIYENVQNLLETTLNNVLKSKIV